jgi:hypothetical protein
MTTIVAWSLCFFELTFFYLIIKYYKKKRYKLKAQFPPIWGIIPLLMTDYFGLRKFLLTNWRHDIFYDIPIILFLLLLNASIFFKLKKLPTDQGGHEPGCP